MTLPNPSITERESSMNKENILKVANAIENRAIPELGFNMGTFRDDINTRNDLHDASGSHCGTVACIAGWAEAVRLNTSTFDNDGGVPDRSQEYLGLDQDQADVLFYGFGGWNDLTQISPDEAVAVLRHLAETGKVDWSVS
jgi:hypothetical protein